MARSRKTPITLDTVFFSTPEQRVIRFLLSEPTTSYTIRVLGSKLKGVRGLGGSDGIMKILDELKELGLVEYLDNNRSVRLHDEGPAVQLLKSFVALSDLENLRKMLEPISSKAILFGSRALGRARSDSDYDVFVVSDAPEEVKKAARGYPLPNPVELVVWTPEQFADIDDSDPNFAEKLARGIVLWGSSW